MGRADLPGEYVAGKISKMRPSVCSSSRVVAALAGVQFALAIYATFLLYCMNPPADLRTAPDFSWAAHVVRHWKQMALPASQPADGHPLKPEDVCERERINFPQKKSDDQEMVRLKRELYDEILDFQRNSTGAETLAELLAMKSRWARGGPDVPKITVILNHFKRKTLCAQLDALLQQTVPFHALWVLSLGSPNEDSLRRIVKTYNDSRISFVGSSYDFKYYGRFQMALQTEADFVYLLDDDMIPGRRMLEILAHAGGTNKYRDSLLGSIGRILPFRQRDSSFPSYRKLRSKEAGLYLPDPAYNITVDRVVQVDFLSSSWFLSADLVKTLFVETPFTWATGEDLHLSYQLQRYRGAGSFVLPVDPRNRETWGDSEHRLAYVSETTVIFKDVVQVRDEQWWRAVSSGYVTRWAVMNPQTTDVLFYAHTVDEVRALAPLLEKFLATEGKKAYIAVSGGTHCLCEVAAVALRWPAETCKDRRFKIFDVGSGAISGSSRSEVPLTQSIYSGVKGLIKIHNPTLLVAVDDVDPSVRGALRMAVGNGTSLVMLPRSSVESSLWMADVGSAALRNWSKMKISVNVITQNRPDSLRRLLRSLSEALYLGDEVPITFNIDRAVDEATLVAVSSFGWTHGPKRIRRRVVQGGLIRAVTESWYPSSDDDFGVLLEDDIEVSRYYYLWIKYALLAYHYDPGVSLPELASVSLYTPRLVEVVMERPRWNPTEFFGGIHPNTPYLHQLPCSWGAVFFPKHWREFYAYMGSRFAENAKESPVKIPRSRTNGWQASWKKFLIDMMYLRGYVALYPNFPGQASFSTNHMEQGAHIRARENVVEHKRDDFEVPLLREDFSRMLPGGKLPPASKLPVLDLFNQPVSLRGLKASGARLNQDVLDCGEAKIVQVDDSTGLPKNCAVF